VLHILPNFDSGGAERMAVNLMRTLSRDRFEVGAISLFDPAGTELEEVLAQSGIPVWYLGKRRGLDPRMFARIARVLRRFRPHVVHTHRYVLRYALPPVLGCRIPATVHTVHNLAEKEVDRPGQWVHRVAFKCGVTPVAIAEEVYDSLQGLYGVGGLPLIPNGIPMEPYRRPSVAREAWRELEGFSSEDVLFVCVARLSHQKNPVLLLESFARGPASDPGSRLLFVGEGEFRSELEKRVKAMGLQEKVHLLGVRPDVPEILNAADVFVLASDWEGNPLSVMEAMAAGTPVISTAVGGVPELIEDSRSGLLVPKGDAEALSRAMSYLLETPEAREVLGKASVERAVELFDARVMTRAYEELYESVLAKS
jgi:glycosyltransferase involved in cell wall biosynthesis